MKFLRSMWWLGVWILAAVASPAHAEDYVLGAEDVVSISVWLHPELERVVSLNADGNITYPPLGDFKASGLTTRQLSDRLADRLTAYLRQTATVTVVVKEFLSHSIYISGAVARPGRYGFERMPGIVDAISQAGGAVPGADLSRVQLVRREGETRRTILADVSSALRDGIGVNLPPLQPGDTIILPAGASTGGGGANPGDGASVLGEVNKPGVYPLAGGQDLWAVLAVAGGLTARGDLERVHVVTRQSDNQAVFTVNLKDALKRSTRAPFVVRPGDVVVVGTTGGGAWGRGATAFTQVLSVGRDLLNIAVLADVLKRGGR